VVNLSYESNGTMFNLTATLEIKIVPKIKILFINPSYLPISRAGGIFHGRIQPSS
jgi:hypothetical protein